MIRIVEYLEEHPLVAISLLIFLMSGVLGFAESCNEDKRIKDIVECRRNIFKDCNDMYYTYNECSKFVNDFCSLPKAKVKAKVKGLDKK